MNRHWIANIIAGFIGGRYTQCNVCGNWHCKVNEVKVVDWD